MKNQLSLSEQYFSKAWSLAHQIGDDVDPNLKAYLIFLASGLLTLTKSHAADSDHHEQQKIHQRSMPHLHNGRGGGGGGSGVDGIG